MCAKACTGERPETSGCGEKTRCSGWKNRVHGGVDIRNQPT